MKFLTPKEEYRRFESLPGLYNSQGMNLDNIDE